MRMLKSSSIHCLTNSAPWIADWSPFLFILCRVVQKRFLRNLDITGGVKQKKMA